MSMELSVDAKDMLTRGLLNGESPFEHRADGLHVRHDAIRMTIDVGRVTVDLMWRGQTIGSMPVVMAMAGDSVTVEGIQGSQKVVT